MAGDERDHNLPQQDAVTTSAPSEDKGAPAREAGAPFAFSAELDNPEQSPAPAGGDDVVVTSSAKPENPHLFTEESEAAADTLEHLEKVDEQDHFYVDVLKALLESKDLGIDAVAKGRIEEMMHGRQPPQLICRDMVNQKVINRIQLARAVARSQNRRELVSFLDVPQEAMNLQ